MPDTPPIFDGHNDALLALRREDETVSDFLAGRDTGDLDLPRAREGGLAAGFFALFVPSGPEFSASDDANRTETDDGYRIERPPPLAGPYARSVVGEMLDAVDELATDDRVRVCRDVDDVRACISGDELGVVVHFEGAEAIRPDCSNFGDYYDRGLRSLGLAWSRPTAFADGVPFRYPSSPDVGGGLTDAGRRLVRRCNDRGVLVDCAHLTAAGFWDVHEVSSAPTVVSHSGAHEVCPLSRNLTDEQLDAVADTGGLVGLTFGASALRPDGGRDPDAPLSVAVEHVDYLVDRMGIDHVALGSDFDGATTLAPLGDATALPDLLRALREAGYSERDIEKIAHGNWLRVLSATW
ncbi:dipeptidase [Halobacterium litoreum]|uniref:Dipeptidase n=1 Tax=Halobacterium litoreum TaxID=2039234 RepID=A0ABD5NFQ8_9EURY|nr:dipeptidase [Halobacterium litoreum]UHH13401.1 dipeptidase [Halobacterium litoreum]